MKVCTKCNEAKTIRAAQGSYRVANRETIASRKQSERLKRNYGLTPDQYEGILQAQGYRCAICRCDDPGQRWGRWCVDHCHETGKVRGLLCDHCNKALGVFGDNLEGIEKVREYLQRPSIIVGIYTT